MSVSTPRTDPAPPADSSNTEAIPPLKNGDRLTRTEFERRYTSMPHVKKAELIEGVVYMPSPVRLRKHARPNSHLVFWLCGYESATPGVIVGDGATVRLDDDTEVQPDALLLIGPEHGGKARISDDDYVEGTPELVAEVAASSASFGLGVKLNVYRRAGVREYIVWRVLDREIEWRVLGNDAYEQIKPAGDGILRSTVFPGLWLDVNAMLSGDLARLLSVVQEGMSIPEHADFVTRLGPSPATGNDVS
jgi:Uma2 family endonuclease